MSAISIGGDLIHYEVLGRGRPVVLLHSWVGSWRYWVPIMQQLKINYKVYAIDLYGYGDTVKNSSKYSLEHQISLIEDFIDNLGIPKLVLVGHGLGAMVAVEYARRHEDKVPRMLLASAPLFDPGDLDKRARAIPKMAGSPRQAQVVPAASAPDTTVMSVNAAMRTALAEAAARRGAASVAPQKAVSAPVAEPPAAAPNNMLRKHLIDERKATPQKLLDMCFKNTDPEYKKLQADVGKADERAIAASVQVFDAGKMLDALRRLKSPVVVVHGRNDEVIEAPDDKVWDYLTLGKGNTLLPVLLDGVRHFPMLEHDRFPRLLNDFLEAPDVTKLEIKERWTRRSH